MNIFKSVKCSVIVCTAIMVSLVAAPGYAAKKSHYPSYNYASKQAKAQRLENSHYYNNTNLINHIAAENDLPHYVNTPEVQQQIRFFQQNKKFVYRVLSQGKPYMYYIFHEVNKRDLPSELVLLPVIESAYDPFAHSWVGAAGLWQFMPRTAQGMGIKQNWWYDGRRDVIQSTQGALDYLTYLNDLFNGNWLLAIAAYNAGEGTVSRAMKRNKHAGKSTEFWHLDLPNETKKYVPRLLAFSAIINNPQKYGFNLPKLHAKPYFSGIELNQQIDLAHAAELAEITLTELYQLNPGYSRWTTAPGGPHRLLLPTNNVAKFRDNFTKQYGQFTNKAKVWHIANIPERQIVPPKNSDKVIYTVQRGDSLSKIASKHNVKLAQLAAWNRLNSKAMLPAGKRLVIWQNKVVLAQQQAAANPKELKPSTPVEQGANKLLLTENTQTAKLTELFTNSSNDVPNLYADKPNQIGQTYKVKPGDTIGAIAKSFHVSPQQLRQANALNSDLIRANQTLTIPKLAQTKQNNKSSRST